MISECTQYSIGFSTAFCVLMKTLRNQASKLYQEVIQIMLAHLFLYHWLYRDNHCNQHLWHDEAHCKLDKHQPSSITTKNSITLSWQHLVYSYYVMAYIVMIILHCVHYTSSFKGLRDLAKTARAIK